jgi:hypothetical protein
MKPARRSRYEPGLKAARTRLKRRQLRSRSLRESNLDPAGRNLLNGWAAVAAQVEACNDYFDAHGLIDEATGEIVQPGRLYIQVLNASQRALAALDAHLDRLTAPDPEAELRAYLEGKT